MNKKKITTIVGLSVIALVFVVTVIVAQYFFTLAVGAKGDKSMVFAAESKAEVLMHQKEAESFLQKNPQEVYIQSTDGLRLHAYMVKNNSSVYAVVIHGYTSNALRMGPVAEHFIKLGYNVLVPDLRGQGKSDGEVIGMGVLDSEDVLQWLSYIIAQDRHAQIVLYGVSMGGATVMLTTGKKNLPTQVKVAIEDCGYTSVWDQFAYQLKRLFSLPAFPLLHITSLYARIMGGYSFFEGDCVQAVRRSHTPTLFIHGSADTFVPSSMLLTLYNAAQCPKEKLIIDGAMHSGSREKNPVLYWNTIDAWINRWVSIKE